jgi:hypothetical protein
MVIPVPEYVAFVAGLFNKISPPSSRFEFEAIK